MIESLIKKEGHLVVFLPKFHCELNAIEMVSLDLQLYFGIHLIFNSSLTALGLVQVLVLGSS